MKQINEAHGQKKHNCPKDYMSAMRKGNRDAEMDVMGNGFHSKQKMHKTSKMDKPLGKKVDLNKVDLDESVKKLQITETDIHKLVRESLRRIIKEGYDYKSGNPAIYVGTYGKYNNGSLKGEWIDLTDFDSKEEFLQYCNQLHSDEPDAELMFQDYENIPEMFVGESWIDERFWDYLNNTNYDYDIKEALANECSDVDELMDILDNGDIRIWADCEDMSDVAYRYVEELGAEGIGDRYFDYDAFGRDCSYDGPSEDSGAETIYDEYDVPEGNDYQLGEAIIDQIYGGIENLDRKTIENYIDYQQLGRELGWDGRWISYDNGYIEIF